MNVKDFKAGCWEKRFEYKAFIPSHINQQWEISDPELTTRLEKAATGLSTINAFAKIVPDINLFIQMHVVKEAESSARIEGTNTKIEEALLPENQIPAERRNDWREVNNYIIAMNQAIERLPALPLSLRLLKETHEQLLQGVRGQDKFPGEFRTSQNWIGGSSPANAFFVPPPPETVSGLMGDLESFWHNDEIKVPHLIRCAISHYQFETIHPFCDGNGRIGRLLIPFYLISQGLLEKPSLYISQYFEQNRKSYYDMLMRVRSADDLTGWIAFFLDAVIATAKSGERIFREIFNLREELSCYCVKNRMKGLNEIIRLFYQNPRMTIEQAVEKTGKSYTTIYRLVKGLEKDRYLVPADASPKRNQIYDFRRYIDIFTKTE